MSNHRDDEKIPEAAQRPGKESRERFAEALARSEFGRFYWNDHLERRLNEAMRRRPRPPAGPSKR